MSYPMPSIFFPPYDMISSSIDSCHLASITKCINVYCAATAQSHDEQPLFLFQKARSPAVQRLHSTMLPTRLSIS